MSPLIATLAELVRINSVNPEWGGPGEAGVAAYVTGFLKRHGIAFELQEILPGRANVIAVIPGKNPDLTVVLEAHMDTVSVEGMSIDPFDPVIEGGRLRGRGACDTKAGLAAMLHALVAVRSDGRLPATNILLAAVVDEEHAFRGVTGFVESLHGKTLPVAAIVAEPTGLRVVRANKGVLRWRIRCHGVAAHSSTPMLGVNAISAMADVIQTIDRAPFTVPDHPLVGVPTCNIGVINGGRQVNFVPDLCEISLDRRLLPGESVGLVMEFYDRLLDSVRQRHPKVRVESEAPFLTDEAMETPADADVVRVASKVLGEMNLDPEPIGVPFGCDCTKLSRAGIPSIIFGPGSIGQAHTADEFVELRQVERAFDFYRHFLLQFEKP
jgi:acetylornithine deacetylase/succinyl-diaminopimelate desuccinylase family protein